MNSNNNGRGRNSGRRQDPRYRPDPGYRQDNGERFQVHISDDDYEREMSHNPNRGSRQPYPEQQRRDHGYPDAGRSRDAYYDRAVQERAPRRQAPVKQKRKHGLSFALLYALFVILASTLLSAFIITRMTDAMGLVEEGPSITVEIPKQASVQTVTDILTDNGIIEYPNLFKLYAKGNMKNIDSENPFIEGSYTLNRNSDYFRIYSMLTHSTKEIVPHVTIPEGLNMMQIFDILSDRHICENEKIFLDTVNTRPWKHEFYPALSNKVSASPVRSKYALEGYMFPATYDFYIREGPVYSVNRLLNAFNDKVYNSKTLNLNDRIAELNSAYSESVGVIDLDFIITMASILEREAKTEDDMKNVASVFYNRLKKTDSEGINGFLQSDATQWYPYPTREYMLEKTGWNDQQAESFVSSNPYNTYVNPGLPPGPICNPGLKAIGAALNPADTKYLYFMSDSEGKFHYAKTYSDFQKILSKYGS